MLPKRSKKPPAELAAEAVFKTKPRRIVPFDFVLTALDAVHPWTRLMFGCTAVYVGEKIVLILRDRPASPNDNGVWLATTIEHHGSLRREFPSMRSIKMFGKAVTDWQLLPVDEPDFEEAALHACQLVLDRDPRIGKVPGEKEAREAKTRRA
jgi:hypothetical protein